MTDLSALIDRLEKHRSALHEHARALESAYRELAEAIATPFEPGPIDPIDPIDPVERDRDFEQAWSATFSGNRPGIQVALITETHPRYKERGIKGPIVIDDQNVIGEGATVAAAFKDYKNKNGRKAGAPEEMSQADYAAANWFSTPGNVTPPTSVRKSSRGFECDFHREGMADGEKVGPFDTVAEAIQEMRDTLGDRI